MTRRTRIVRLLLSPPLLALLAAAASRAGEADALAIARRVQDRHLPHGVVVDPIYAAPQSDDIVGYGRCGDAALWSGHYLAAESLRYAVTREEEAFAGLLRVLAGLEDLVEVTGGSVLARCLVPVDSPWAQSMLDEESRHGVHVADLRGVSHYWFGNTSRDQYAGVFFGLGVLWDAVGDAGVRARARSLVGRLLADLTGHGWFVVLPGGEVSTSFATRPDLRLMFLQLGRRTDPGRWQRAYERERFWHAGAVGVGVYYDLLDDHRGYFKYNLNAITFYHLIRHESSGFYRALYRRPYEVMRRTTDDHGNAHFNLIDRALRGPDPRRDQETQLLLAQWLEREDRDPWLDWRGDPRYPACGEDRACEPIAVGDRVRTDFLWQRSPFLLYGGGAGTIEGAGIDYLLPYWMARAQGLPVP